MSYMRILAAAATVLTATATAVPAQAQHGKHAHTGSMPVGYHEFRLFGGDGRYYISHFPMFSSIHAYQYIVEIGLEEKAQSAMKREASSDTRLERRYQLSPYQKGTNSANRADDEEDWVLPDRLQQEKTFTGDIFYESDGKRNLVVRDTTVTIKRIIWKAELNPALPRPTDLTYILFGTPRAAFLAHEITAPPRPGKQETDFDQIVAAEIMGSSKELTNPLTPMRVTLSERKNLESSRLKPGDHASLTFAEPSGATVDVVILQELQMEQLATQR
jgi:hypothetical protein